MAIKSYRPTTPSRRSQTSVQGSDLSKVRPLKSLTRPLKNKSGRSRGRISVRHKGGRHKRLYRVIDFKRHDKIGVLARVLTVEYDPNRSAQIALLEYDDHERRYIIRPEGLAVGDVVESGPKVKIKVGNALPLVHIPVGTVVHNLELYQGQGGTLARSAGSSAVVMSRDRELVQVKLSSGEVRILSGRSYATIGQVSNFEHARITLGKAGRRRWKGIRPSVRGTAMPAGEHPHGGGEGRTGPGRPPKTYKGRPARGVRTRNRKKLSNKFIVRSRRAN